VFETVKCPFTTRLALSFECGFLVVPEDREKPDGAQVRLAVAILRREASDKAPDPILFLEGGPGARALDAAGASAGKINDKRDLIFFDQRGAGYSQPDLDCSEVDYLESEILAQNLSHAEEIPHFLTAFQACYDRLAEGGINLSAYNSAANAEDINDLLIALGYDQANLYGIPYGTRLALTVLRDHPERIRSVVLESTLPVQVDFFFRTNFNYRPCD
jgi:pimeloyl-ACP methyl ester carboxylesterase